MSISGTGRMAGKKNAVKKSSNFIKKMKKF